MAPRPKPPALDRRRLGQGLAAALSSYAAAGWLAHPALAQSAPRVVIIGGGAGGASLANRLAAANTGLDITLVEPEATYTTCFGSNLYLAGMRPLTSLQHGYEHFSRSGIRLARTRATTIDAQRRSVALADGNTLVYDKLVVAPGIEFHSEAIDGYDAATAQAMPAAYRGAGDLELLRARLEAMPDGGTVVIAPPKNPYRCPPAPYERACLIAHYLKTRKPRAKLIIIDPKNAFSKQELFQAAFSDYYDGIVELNLTNEIDDFAIEHVDAKAMTIKTRAGLELKADVANVIPPQRAARIARDAGLAERDWCPVDLATFASKKVADVYVIGDAAITAELPKAAFSASREATVVAADLVSKLTTKRIDAERLRNVCWSTVAPGDCVKLGADYAIKDDHLTAVDPFISKPGEPAARRRENAAESEAWYKDITARMFGSA